MFYVNKTNITNKCFHLFVIKLYLPMYYTANAAVRYGGYSFDKGNKN